MASAERTHVLVRMPADLKRRLADEVARTKQNLNDIAVGILASRFAVPFAGSGRPGSPPKGSGDVLLRMPPQLKEKVARRAKERRRTTNDLIVEALAERLGSRRKETMASTNGKPRRSEDRSASRSSASATAPTRCSRASSTTRTPTRISSCPG